MDSASRRTARLVPWLLAAAVLWRPAVREAVALSRMSLGSLLVRTIPDQGAIRLDDRIYSNGTHRILITSTPSELRIGDQAPTIDLVLRLDGPWSARVTLATHGRALRYLGRRIHPTEQRFALDHGIASFDIGDRPDDVRLLLKFERDR